FVVSFLFSSLISLDSSPSSLSSSSSDSLSASFFFFKQKTAYEIRITPGELSGGFVDCGLAGTVMRFIPPLAALASGPVEIDGDEQARVRPMATMSQALRELGVEVSDDTLPMTVTSTGVPAGGELTIDASGSSQFVSGLLLAAPRYAQGITVRHEGGTLPSMPHIDMTVAMLRQAGVKVEQGENWWKVHPGTISGGTWNIEP